MLFNEYVDLNAKLKDDQVQEQNNNEISLNKDIGMRTMGAGIWDIILTLMFEL